MSFMLQSLARSQVPILINLAVKLWSWYNWYMQLWWKLPLEPSILWGVFRSLHLPRLRRDQSLRPLPVPRPTEEHSWRPGPGGRSSSSRGTPSRSTCRTRTRSGPSWSRTVDLETWWWTNYCLRNWNLTKFLTVSTLIRNLCPWTRWPRITSWSFPPSRCPPPLWPAQVTAPGDRVVTI